MVRLKCTKLITVLVFLVNVILLFYTWKWFLSNESNNDASTVSSSKLVNGANRQKDKTNRHIKKAITIIFRDFYHFENDLQHSIENILNLVPSIQILVCYEDEIYPPLSFVANYTTTHPNVKFINLNFDIRKTFRAQSPLLQIKTGHVLFVPDSFRFKKDHKDKIRSSFFQKILLEIEKESIKNNVVSATDSVDVKKSDNNLVGSVTAEEDQNTSLQQGDNIDFTTINDKNKVSGKATNRKRIAQTHSSKILVIPFASNVNTMSNCCRINIDIANWTMEYSVRNNTYQCDMVNKLASTQKLFHFLIECLFQFLQKHAILVDTNLLKTMPDPLASPFPEMFYVQAKMCKAKVRLNIV